MKQFNRSDSLGALVSNCSPKDDKNPNSSQGYSREFQAMLDSFDEEDCAEESSLVTGKKRRLSLEQVKALEKSFEVENKIEPDRKAKIAQELGLQPRQVAIWFQNRRARWKAKQMEKDYGLLKSDYDALKINYECLEQQKSVLNSELRELKEKLQKKNKTANQSVKEDALFSETEHNVSEAEQSKISPGGFYDDSEPTKLAHNLCNKNNAIGFTGQVEPKDGLSDSDSSEFLVLNGTNLHHHPQTCPPYFSAGSNFSSSPSSSMNWFHPLWNTREIAARAYQQQFGRAEEQNLFGTTEESCNFFSVDLAPTLHWYNLDQSN